MPSPQLLEGSGLRFRRLPHGFRLYWPWSEADLQASAVKLSETPTRFIVHLLRKVSVPHTLRNRGTLSETTTLSWLRPCQPSFRNCNFNEPFGVALSSARSPSSKDLFSEATVEQPRYVSGAKPTPQSHDALRLRCSALRNKTSSRKPGLNR